MQIIRGLSNSKRWKQPEVYGILLLCICIEVHGSMFLTLWESRCKDPHSKQPMDVVIKDVIHYIQEGNLANIYEIGSEEHKCLKLPCNHTLLNGITHAMTFGFILIGRFYLPVKIYGMETVASLIDKEAQHQRNSKLDFNVCEWRQVTSTNERKNELENITSECIWTKYLPRKLSGKDIKTKSLSLYRGLSTYAVLLQHMEDNEILWTNNLSLDSEHSGQHKIHELQNYLLTIGCIIESINGKKPKVDVGKLYKSIKLSTDFANGSSEGNYATKRMEKFLESSQKRLKDNKKKRGQNKEGGKISENKTRKQRKNKSKRKEIM